MTEAERDDSLDDDDDLDPPTAERVARRCIVLAMMSCRGMVERDVSQSSTAPFWQEVRAWFEGLGIDSELEPGERELLDVPLGELQAQRALDAGWLCEGMVVLAWALGRAELPPFTVMCSPGDIASGLGFRAASAQTVLAEPELRSSDEIDNLDETYLAAHWRLREYSLRPRKMDFVDYVDKCEWASLRVDDLEIVHGDLALDGVAIDAAKPQRRSQVTSIVRERHRATNWLCGTERLWSDVTTDT